MCVCVCVLQVYERKGSLLIYRTHNIMFATSARERIHRMLLVLRLSSKLIKRDFCA